MLSRLSVILLLTLTIVIEGSDVKRQWRNVFRHLKAKFAPSLRSIWKKMQTHKIDHMLSGVLQRFMPFIGRDSEFNDDKQDFYDGLSMDDISKLMAALSDITDIADDDHAMMDAVVDFDTKSDHSLIINHLIEEMKKHKPHSTGDDGNDE